MYRFFEKFLSPYPKEEPQIPSKSLAGFLWQVTKGARIIIFSLIFFSALCGAFEAILFALLGEIVDWLSVIEPTKLWQQEKTTLIVLTLVILASTFIVALQSIIKHQCLAGNFPMRLRWNLHRLVLNQGMRFFQDEFAGRISAKVMQTSLAVRDTCFLIADILVVRFNRVVYIFWLK